MTTREGFAKVDDLDEVKAGVVSRYTIYSLIRSGRLPYVRLSTRRYLVPTDWATRLMQPSSLES